jgi:hypothetical protein
MPSITSCYTSNHSAGLVEPSYFSIAFDLKFGSQTTHLRSWENGMILGASMFLAGEWCHIG